MDFGDIPGKITGIILSIIVIILLNALGINKWISQILGQSSGVVTEEVINKNKQNANKAVKEIKIDYEKIRIKEELELEREKRELELEKIKIDRKLKEVHLKELKSKRKYEDYKWKEKISVLAETKNFYTVKFKNMCDETIYVSVNYKDISGNWIVVGWWTVKPNSVANTNIKTWNRNLYFYAESINDKVWAGSNNKVDIKNLISSNKFSAYSSADKLEGLEDVRTKTFFHVDTGNTETEYIQTFRCTN